MRTCSCSPDLRARTHELVCSGEMGAGVLGFAGGDMGMNWIVVGEGILSGQLGE